MNATWIDRTGTAHRLQINGLKAKQLLSECELNLMQCLVETGHIQLILTRLAENPEVLMAACACLEDIPAAGLDYYYALWDGDAFESASVAILEAIADFFPSRPRQILSHLTRRMQTLNQAVGEKAVTVAINQIDQMGFSSGLRDLMTRGSGGTGSVVSSEPDLTG